MEGRMLMDLVFFLIISLVVAMVSLAIKHDEPRKILLSSLKLFAMIVGGIILFCVVVQVLQAGV